MEQTLSDQTLDPTASDSRCPSQSFAPIHSPLPPPDWEVIRRRVRAFSRRLARRFPRAFAESHATSTKEAVIGWVREALPPHPGRPRKASITLACELKRQGVPWHDIYHQCIPQYAALKWGERRLEIARLRNAVRARAPFR
jgi:hypothetical protein